ncbi:hypothetical protein DJ68_05105 [Halorubrum sp. C3]|nr:hypothetical protein DJ68_05105 [Halorubrum sp. C3]
MNAEKAEMTSELKIRTSIEDQLIPELHSMDASDQLEVSLVVPFITEKHEDAVIHLTEFDDHIHIEIFVQNRDLSSLQRNWNGVTYPKPPKSPRPYETEFHEHGEPYESYRDLVVNAVATDLGLKSDLSLSDAVSEGSEPIFTCQGYAGAHSDFGPDQETRVPYLCAFQKEAFFELD